MISKLVKVLFIALLLIVNLSCKKEKPEYDVNQEYQTWDLSDSNFATGYIDLTIDDIKDIQSTDEIDISLLSKRFGKTNNISHEIQDIPTPTRTGQVFESCVGWVLGYALMTYYSKVYDNPITGSPAYIWNPLANKQNIGIKMTDGLKRLSTNGVCDISYMRANEHFNFWPSQEADENAKNYKIDDYLQFYSVNIERMKAFIDLDYPLPFGFIIDSGFIGKSASYDIIGTEGNKRYVYRRRHGNEIGGHAMIITGYDDEIQAFKVQNSWGNGVFSEGKMWGNGGVAWIDYEIFKNYVMKTSGKPHVFLVIDKIVETGESIDITGSTATIEKSIIISEATSKVIERGICYDKDFKKVEINAGKSVKSGDGIGEYVTELQSLEPKTKYYYRGYAKRQDGTVCYGKIKTLTTLENLEVLIGSQTWMVKNLDVSTYRNGDPIPQVTNLSEFMTMTTGAWCYYENKSSHGTVYGKLYNWYAVNDPRGLAPLGWHIPSLDEVYTLRTFLGGKDVAGGKMKEAGYSHWVEPNTGATNSCGFTALPSGNDGTVSLGEFAMWWTSTESQAVYSDGAQYFVLEYDHARLIAGGHGHKYYVGAVRCIKD